MKTHLTLSQRIHNAEGMQAAEYLHARHTYLHATSYCKEEWGEFWDTSEEASWGHLFGVMCGFDEVWYNSVSNYDPDGFRGYINLVKQHPEISWFDARSIREISMHTLATDIIEAADDGKTVRASFLTPGVLVFALNANHHYRGLTLWERYGSDYVYEDGQWLYLHEQVCPDIMAEFDDLNWARKAYDRACGQGMGMPPHGNPPIVDSNPICQDPGPLHGDYDPLRPVTDTVPYPTPYKTMDNDNTYTTFRDDPGECDREFEAAVFDRGAHAFARLLDGRVRQADEIERRKPRADVAFRLHLVSVDAGQAE